MAKENCSLDFERRDCRRIISALRQMAKEHPEKRVYSQAEINKYLDDLEAYYKKLEAKLK